MAQPSGAGAKDALRSTARSARAKQGEDEAMRMCMHHVYLLRSAINPRKTYVGYTERSVEERLTEHNAGLVPYTVRHRPWEIVACVAVPDKHKALALERYFKTGSGHAFAHRHLW